MDEAALLNEAMLAWFPPSGTVELSTRSTFTETDLRGISDLLYRSGKHSWSRIPRIYTTLRLINELDVMDAFLSCGITDLSLPFSQRTLPGQLKDQSSRVRFLDVQSRVLTKALDLEKEKGKHRHFSNPDDLPFKKVAELGKGGYGFVDKVLSTVTYREYARKLIPRGRTFRQDRDLLRNFENELQVLKKLSHRHMVRFIGSYTDPHYVGLLMDPVADCNLKILLSAHPLSSDTRSLVRTFYGCLASAVLYLHENKLRHKDIKPENVLVKSHHVYLTDFGTTLDWSDTGHDTTTGLASGLTLRYSAPEVATNQPRNASADIWSLGCVFLEIWTELCDHSTSELNSFMKDQGTKSSLYYANISAVREWCDVLSSRTDNDAHIPDPWIRSMLEIDPSTRCGIQSLVEDIQTSNFGSDVSDSFSGLCCNGGYIIAESVVSSHYEASIIVPNQHVAASVARSSAGTVISAEEIIKHDVMSSRLTVEKRGRSVHSEQLDREPTTRRSKTTVSEKRNEVSGAQSDQKPTETTHEEVETARYADWAPDVNDERSRAESRYGARRDQSIRRATSKYDIEASSPTLGCLPDIKKVDQVSGADSSLLSSNADRCSHVSGTSSINNPKLQAKVEDAIKRLILPELNALKEENRTSRNIDKFDRANCDSIATFNTIESEHSRDPSRRRVSKSSSAPKLHSTDDLSKPTYDHHTKSLGTPHSRRRRRKHEKTHVQTGSNQHKPFMLEPPKAHDERTVKEVIYQWLTNFDPSTYCKVMTVNTVEYPSVPMYRLGEKSYEPKLSSFTEAIEDAHQKPPVSGEFGRRAIRNNANTPCFSMSILGVWKDACHVLDAIHVPYFVNEDHIVCFYPEGILPTYYNNDTTRMKGLRSFELLNERRYEALQWWHGCLTSPQGTWTEKLKTVRSFRIEISGTVKSLKLDVWQLTPLSTEQGSTQIPGNKRRSKDMNTYRHICAALGHSCFTLFEAYAVEHGTKATLKGDTDSRRVNVLYDIRVYP